MPVAKRFYGITAGDASGIGPEILLKAWQAGQLHHNLIVYGDAAALGYYDERCGTQVPFHRISTISEWEPGKLNVIDSGLLEEGDITPGKISAAAGRAAREYVVTATKAALAGEIAAIVTLPMNKEATRLSDPKFTGHTELIGELCGVADVTIMLASDQLIVTHVTTHVSLQNAIRSVTRERVATILRLTSDAVGRLKPNPRIAVAGLNPHAGENGLFGEEELDEIIPAIEWARQQGMPVSGPFPPDTVFYAAVRKKQFDAVVCMYHDQGHIPLKLLDFEGGVNVTLGLPIIRTSVDHGTAFDIAGKGIASFGGLIEALEFAVRLAEGNPTAPDPPK